MLLASNSKQIDAGNVDYENETEIEVQTNR